MVETYPRDIFRAGAEAIGSEGGGDASLLPLDADSLVKKEISSKDRKIFHPAPMEDGVAGVADAKIWARVQATVRRAVGVFRGAGNDEKIRPLLLLLLLCGRLVV